jgi:hypothetical protein
MAQCLSPVFARPPLLPYRETHLTGFMIDYKVYRSKDRPGRRDTLNLLPLPDSPLRSGSPPAGTHGAKDESL